MSRVLVVDDEPSIVEGIQAMLGLHAIEAEGAWDCDSAELAIAGKFFPVILADLRMRSEEEGFRLLDSVRRISPGSRVATMTGAVDAATEQRLRERGSQLILRKPFAEDELIAALRAMLQAVEAAEASCVTDDVLYAATLDTLQAITRGRYGFSREDAEELVQEAWVLYLEKRRDVRTPRAWLSGTVANLCRQEIDRRRKHRDRTVDLSVDLADATGLGGSRGDGDTVLAVRQALARLDPRARTLCTLIGLEQHSYEEVSRTVNLPLGSVGPLYMRAKAQLKRVIAN